MSWKLFLMEKYFPTNKMKFVFTNGRHNLFHWLMVVLIKIITSLIMFPLSAYIIAFGFFLASEIIQPYLLTDWFEVIIYLSNQLPYFQSIQQFVLGQLSHWYQDIQNWRGIVIGLPLIVLGVCIFLINFFNLYYSIFSSKYNRTHCLFCKKPMEIKT